MKKFLVQEKQPGGAVTVKLASEAEVIRDLGFRDCSDCEYEVYDVSCFGKAVKLVEAAGDTPNHQIMVNPETGKSVIEGYSPIH